MFPYLADVCRHDTWIDVWEDWQLAERFCADCGYVLKEEE